MRILFLILLFLVSCSPVKIPSTASLAEESSVVLLRRSFDEDGFAKYKVSCGGVAIGQHLIITAAHCVKKLNAEVYYITRENWFSTGSGKDVSYVSSLDKTTDIAYLTTQKTLLHYTNIVKPIEGEFKIVVRRFQVNNDYSNNINRLDLKLSEGDSGSGVFNEDSKLIGIIVNCDTKSNTTINDHAPCSVGGIYRDIFN